MLTTAKEANSKRCPQIDNRYCVDEGCMAWRRHYKNILNIKINKLDKIKTGLGYCGLAGKPEGE